MDKEATDLLNLALLSLLAGGGAYSGMRLAKDIPNEGKQQEENKNELNITLPSSRMPQPQQHKFANETGVGDYFWPAVTGVGGATAGFLGMSGLYEHVKKKQLEKKLQGVNQDYMNALEQAHTKVSSVQTPLTDNFLGGLLAKAGEEIQKLGYVDPKFLGGEGVFDTIGHQARNAGNAFFDTELGKMSGAAMLLAALGSAGATYGIAKKMDNEKQDVKDKTTLPTDIRLNVAH